MSEAVLESRNVPRDGVFDMEGADLDRAILAWRASLEAQRDHHRNRQLLAQIAIQLVQAFRAEEAGLLEVKAPELAVRRAANHRVALQLRNLMTEAEQGVNVAPGLRDMFKIWQRQQACLIRLSAKRAFGH